MKITTLHKLFAHRGAILTYICVFWLLKVVCHWLPDKVQEGISSADLLYLLLLGELIF